MAQKGLRMVLNVNLAIKSFDDAKLADVENERLPPADGFTKSTHSLPRSKGKTLDLLP